MSDVIAVNPSLSTQVRRYGRFDAGGCENCGTCALICDLSEDGAPFPRRPIQYALVGLEARLKGSLEPWLCHDCGDCSVKCPREAEPRDSMATLRRWLIAQYDWTGLSSRIQTSRAWAAGSLLSAGALVVVLMVWYHMRFAGMSFSDLATQSMGLSHMFPTITYFTLVVVLLPLFLLASGAVRMHRFVMGGGAGAAIPASAYLSELSVLLRNMATQEGFVKCPDRESGKRRAAHWLLAAGVTLMFVLVVFFLRSFQADAFNLLHLPGYAATAFMLYGGVAMLAGRLGKEKPYHKNSGPGDFTLPVLLLLVAVSGIAIPILRAAGLPFAVHYCYLAHLVVTVPLLVVEVPFGKCSHMLYRPLAVYLKAVREHASAQKAPEVQRAA